MEWLVLVDFFFQAEDGIRDLVRSRGLGDVYKRQAQLVHRRYFPDDEVQMCTLLSIKTGGCKENCSYCCLLYTSDAADERSSVDLGGRRIIKKKKTYTYVRGGTRTTTTTAW